MKNKYIHYSDCYNLTYCSDTSQNKDKNINNVTCPHCIELYKLFFPKVSERWCYTGEEIKDKLLMQTLPY